MSPKALYALLWTVFCVTNCLDLSTYSALYMSIHVQWKIKRVRVVKRKMCIRVFSEQYLHIWYQNFQKIIDRMMVYLWLNLWYRTMVYFWLNLWYRMMVYFWLNLWYRMMVYFWLNLGYHVRLVLHVNSGEMKSCVRYMNVTQSKRSRTLSEVGIIEKKTYFGIKILHTNQYIWNSKS
jgi:hypothetical protein